MAEEQARRTRPANRRTPPRAERVSTAAQAAHAARESLAALIDHPVDGTASVARVDDGWSVGVDVVEVRRIPDTTSLMATYEVQLDSDGELRGYRRARRYRRCDTDE